MWFFAEILDRNGAVVSRAEAEVAEEGDLAGLVSTAIDYYRKARPEESLLSDIGHSGYSIRVGKP